MQPDKKDRKAKRGPYDYGDQPRKPKTLEEIMEEVRREAAKAKAVTPQPRASEVEAPKPRAELRSSFDEEPKAAPVPATVRAAPVTGGSAVQRKVRSEIPSLPDAGVRASPLEVRAIEQKIQEAAPFARAAIAPSELPVSKPGMAALDLIQMIRNAPREQKLIAARQAIMLTEIFGPPRAKRPFARDRIM